MDLIRHFEKQQLEGVERPGVRAGDIVRVQMKVTEGEKTRLQTFEGTVLSVRGGGPSRTFTVRREIGRFAVERIFPLFSPLITSIEIVKRQKVRRAKLNYLRTSGRRRIKEDEKAMQRHAKTESDKKRLAEEAKKREEKRKAEEMRKKEQVETEAPEEEKAEESK
jgi:large subunit ribosomal protein L19